MKEMLNHEVRRISMVYAELGLIHLTISLYCLTLKQQCVDGEAALQ